MAAQYSFVMKGLSKTFPGAPKPILSNIQLQFYPDAKIGIVGPNGSGKSTLMKIMAGRDKEFIGEAWPGEGIRVGYLEQEPQLDPDQDGPGECHGRRPPGRRHARPVQRDQRADGRPARGRRFRRADGRDGRAPGEDRRGRRLDARQPARDRDGRPALPARRRLGPAPFRRREAPHRAHPPAARKARNLAARRADQPSRRRERRNGWKSI